MFYISKEKIKAFDKRIKESEELNLFWGLYTIWFLFISFHFYYLTFALSKNSCVNINELMNTFAINMIMDYILIVMTPIIFSHIIIIKVVLGKPLLDKHKNQLKLLFKVLGFLVLASIAIKLIFV